jgi:hypothetical protein
MVVPGAATPAGRITGAKVPHTWRDIMSTKQMEVIEVSASFVAGLLSKASKAAKAATKAGGQGTAAVTMYLAAKIRGNAEPPTVEDVLAWRGEIAAEMSNPNVLNPTQDIGRLFSYLAFFGDEQRFLDAIEDEASYGVLTSKGISKSGKVEEGKTKPRLPKLANLNRLALDMLNDPDRLAGVVTEKDLQSVGPLLAVGLEGKGDDGKVKLHERTVVKSANLQASKKPDKAASQEAGEAWRNIKADEERIQSILTQYRTALAWIQKNRSAVPFEELPTLGE